MYKNRRREQKKEITHEILDYADSNNLSHATINISDGKLKFQNNRIATPLTFKFMHKCLSQCISNEKQVNQIIEYIKENREIRYVSDIKRYYNKTN